MRACLFAIALAAGLAGCGGDGVKTFKDPHGRLTVKDGEPFRLSLRENPSTGYLWRFAVRPDPAVVRLESSRFKLDDDSEDRAGAGGTRTFRFRAAGKGRTVMVLVDVFTGGERGRRPVDTRRLVVAVD